MLWAAGVELGASESQMVPEGSFYGSVSPCLQREASADKGFGRANKRRVYNIGDYIRLGDEKAHFAQGFLHTY